MPTELPAVPTGWRAVCMCAYAPAHAHALRRCKGSPAIAVCPAGTVMRGGVRVGDTIELPELKAQKKVKSMQMFK